MGTQARTDVQRVVEEFAKDYFQRKATSRSERKLVAKDYLNVKIDWKNVIFADDKPEYIPKPHEFGTGKPKHNVLFHTTFTNKTDKEQRYHFETQRTTRSACTVEIEKGYTMGVEMSIGLKTPCEIFEANVGFHREMSLTNIEGETIEEELTWGVNSDISVSEGKKATAKLVITEEDYSGRFTLDTRISGRVRVVFTNLKDNNSFLKTMEADFYQIIQWGLSNRMIQAGNIRIDDHTVIITTEGKCQFSFGIKQDVVVEEVPFTDSD